MYTKEILAVCTLCAVFFTVNSFPVDTIITKTGKVYQLIPIAVASNNLQRIRRDVFSETINEKGTGKTSAEAETKHAPNEEDNGLLKGERKEMLKAAADTIYPVVYRVRRADQHRRRYEESDGDYDDKDYSGYDRQGSDVGYMDSDDDFPTVVW